MNDKISFVLGFDQLPMQVTVERFLSRSMLQLTLALFALAPLPLALLLLALLPLTLLAFFVNFIC